MTRRQAERTVAIIQARMGSSRLPGKVLMDISGKPMLWHVVNRARMAKSVNEVVIATSTNRADDAILAFAQANGVACYRGSEADVLDRYHQAAEEFHAGVIVRLTADCPLLDPAVIDKVIHAFHAGEYDYVSNTLEPSYPDGLDTEVFLREALGRAWRAATLRSEREHVTPYIWEHPTLFRLANVTHVSDLSSLRWTVDEPEDLEFVRRVVGHLTRVPSFGMAEVLDLLREHPELSEINTGRVRNEGFRKSLCEDKAGAERETP